MEQPKTAHDPPSGVAGSHRSKRLVYGGLGLGLTLSELAEGLVGSEWLLVGIGAIRELRVSVRGLRIISPRTVRHNRHGIPVENLRGPGGRGLSTLPGDSQRAWWVRACAQLEGVG